MEIALTGMWMRPSRLYTYRIKIEGEKVGKGGEFGIGSLRFLGQGHKNVTRGGMGGGDIIDLRTLAPLWPPSLSLRALPSLSLSLTRGSRRRSSSSPQNLVL